MRGPAVAAVLIWLCGCTTLDGPEFGTYDRQERANRASYAVSDAVDRHALLPVARAYRAVLPDWMERGVSNVFANLRTVPSSFNGFAQGKPGRGGTDLARFAINTTLGVGGIFDVASRWNLRASEEDFGQTLAVWGYRRSRYIYVPFLGPSTLRDLPSTLIRGFIPRLLIGSEYHWGYGALDVVSTRAGLLTASDVRDASALDPYAFTRDAYLQRRRFLIYDGDVPLDDFFDEFEEFDEEWEDDPPSGRDDELDATGGIPED